MTRSGKFNFIGYDLSGNEGNEITEGAAFLVDTISPIAPKDAAIFASDEGILLNWYYDGETPSHFNIYRSTTSNPGLIDLYDESNSEEYFDDKKFVFTGHNVEKAVPLGRAKTSVPPNEWDWESECYAKLTDFDKIGSEIYIEPDGTTHICQCSIFAVTSNILDHTYEEVAEHFRSSAMFRALSGAGPQGIAENLGIKADYADKRIKELGECVYCDELHREYPYTIAEIG